MRRIYTAILLITLCTMAYASSYKQYLWSRYDIVRNVDFDYDAADEFHITTPAELAWCAWQTNQGHTFEGKTIILDNDIDLAGKQWDPIGGRKDVNGDGQPEYVYFGGTFNGGNHTISNLTILINEQLDSLYSFVTPGVDNATKAYITMALFGETRNAVISNVTISQPRIYCTIRYTRMEIATVVAMASGTLKLNEIFIESPELKYTYTEKAYKFQAVGGMIAILGISAIPGYSEDIDLTITNCYINNAGIVSNGRAGGMIGYVYNKTNGVIKNNYIANSDICNNNYIVSGFTSIEYDNRNNCTIDILNNYTHGKFHGSKLVQFYNYNCNTQKNFYCNSHTQAVAATNAVKMAESDMQKESFATRLNNQRDIYDEWYRREEFHNSLPSIERHHDDSIDSTHWCACQVIREPSYSDGVLHITTPSELAWVADYCNHGYDTLYLRGLQGITVQLDNDIDLSGLNWCPIGKKGAPFYGDFDGKRHRINSLTIIDNGTGMFVCGLFGYVSGVYGGGHLHDLILIDEVINITFDDSAVSTDTLYTGGLCGVAGVNCDIRRIGVSASISVNNSSTLAQCSDFDTGGLVGMHNETDFSDGADETFVIKQCFTTGSITGCGNTGGIIGACDVKDRSTGKRTDAFRNRITQCFSTAEVTVKSPCHPEITGSSAKYAISGIAAISHGTSLENCYYNKMLTTMPKWTKNGNIIGNVLGAHNFDSLVSCCIDTTGAYKAFYGDRLVPYGATEVNSRKYNKAQMLGDNLKDKFPGWGDDVWDFQDGRYPALKWCKDECISVNAVTDHNRHYFMKTDASQQVLYLQSNQPLQQVLVFELSTKILKCRSELNDTQTNATVDISDLPVGIYAIRTSDHDGCERTHKVMLLVY